MIKYFLPGIFLICSHGCIPQDAASKSIQTGAEQVDKYLELLKNKKIGVYANHTSVVNGIHLVDTLLSHEVNIVRVFGPEHGFYGNRPDGEEIQDDEVKRSIELVSLYGSSKRPKEEEIIDLDLLVIDIQDVGVRFYTYSSTMTYLMEACAQFEVPVLILDRPNPNGSYVDGPVLQKEFKSFVGLHPIPIVHGLTLGELAWMINEEGWLQNNLKCDLKIIKVANWNHNKSYSLPVKPSPNLPNDLAISLYPSLALFEGTVVSVGRGTEYPFQIIGHPAYTIGSYAFTPNPNTGSKYPPLEGQKCYGISFIGNEPSYEFKLEYLISFYKHLHEKLEEPFFNDYFSKLVGTNQLEKQIKQGVSEEEIRATWESNLSDYMKLRSTYLLYD